jgi:hypothetical protein
MPDRTPEPAMRLVFEYDGDQVRLVHQSPVTMVVPDSHPEQNAPGVYVDSRDATNASLARVRAPEALSQSVEVFPSQPGEAIHRVDQPRSGAFTVVVPAPQEADHVTVVQVAHGTEPPTAGLASLAIAGHDGAPATATDLAHFPLTRS